MFGLDNLVSDNIESTIKPSIWQTHPIKPCAFGLGVHITHHVIYKHSPSQTLIWQGADKWLVAHQRQPKR
ncbi:hypothetical protein B0181_07535 [Moraxella caviae]|uniref:Uncharacterized protein n=1 Tax=Moraxella caviae TaxID=34060 RepID=A0A1T0A1B9_9GAMM|nr:hypothetical protein B0181_07535 [Moraxella caviae]